MPLPLALHAIHHAVFSVFHQIFRRSPRRLQIKKNFGPRVPHAHSAARLTVFRTTSAESGAPATALVLGFVLPTCPALSLTLVLLTTSASHAAQALLALALALSLLRGRLGVLKVHSAVQSSYPLVTMLDPCRQRRALRDTCLRRTPASTIACRHCAAPTPLSHHCAVRALAPSSFASLFHVHVHDRLQASCSPRPE